MGFWSKVKEVLGIGAAEDDSKKKAAPDFRDGILNADRHRFRTETDEPRIAEQ